MDAVRQVSCSDRAALARETARFVAPARVVDLAPGNLARLGPVEPARSALTLGVTTILAAGAVLVVASGPGKAEALDRLVHGPGDPAWPVTWLRRHPRLTVAIGPGVVSP